MLCAHCSKSITRHGDGKCIQTNHFRSCDADVCSWNCALTRRDEISLFDPELNYPVYWQFFTSTNDTRKLKRSSSERLLFSNSIYEDRISMDILPIISEEKQQIKNKSVFSIVMLFTVALSLICVVRM